MPIYNYQCSACLDLFETFYSISNRKIPEEEACKNCGAPAGSVKQMITAPMVIDPSKLDGGLKTNMKLKEKFQQIHENTHGSVLDKVSTITKI